MRRSLWIGFGLVGLLLIVGLLPGLARAGGGEVELKGLISRVRVKAGETIVFGQGELPFPGAVVEWDFGDGTPPVRGWPVTHVYREPGVYTVTARLFLPGTGTEVPAVPTEVVVEEPGNLPPVPKGKVVAAGAAAGSVWAGLPVRFDATESYDPSPDGGIVRVEWRFGDGTTAEGVQVEHVYLRPGTYPVILTVTDAAQLSASTILSVTVRALPPLLLPSLPVHYDPAGAPRPALETTLWVVDLGVWPDERFPQYIYPVIPSARIRGLLLSDRTWLVPDPERFDLPEGGQAVFNLSLAVRNTSLLPRAHTNWAQATLALNGALQVLPVAVRVLPPEGKAPEPERVWALLERIRGRLEAADRLDAFVGDPTVPGSGADWALGQITEYLITEGYNGKLSQDRFVTAVAEVLAAEDLDGDGVVGYTEAEQALPLRLGW